MTIVAVQCRLSSSRLPGKAVLPLGGKTVLDWCLSSMKKVKADEYYVATDYDSEKELKPVVERNGFKIFAGSLNDVMDRYCSLIEKTNADIVIRATADNPFLFYEAAQDMLDEYEKRIKTEKIDYITWTGLPHGSGVEIFSAKSLLHARELTDLPYDHEHVGPGLYNHPENFTSLFLPSEKRYNHPQLRTTIDTAADYRRAVRIINKVSNGVAGEPYTCEQIVDSFNDSSIAHPVLLVPCVEKGHGTGHLKRCISIAEKINADIYIPEDKTLEETDRILEEAYSQGLGKYQVTSVLPVKGEYALIVTDSFVIDSGLASKLSELACVVSIDEGVSDKTYADYLLDVIPSSEKTRYVNNSDSSFIELPVNVRKEKRPQSKSDIKRILICAGGEDPAGLVVPASKAFSGLCEELTAVVSDPHKSYELLGEDYGNVKFSGPVPQLKEKLSEYDVVVTHYGLTAFEALAAGCGVILLGTTNLHTFLAKKYGFAYLTKNELNVSAAQKILSDVSAFYPQSPAGDSSIRRSLPEYIQILSKGRRFTCPVCRRADGSTKNPVVARTQARTFRRCSDCSMVYMSWTIDEENTDYNAAYFFDDYKKQYGKTYLEDFEAIKAQCVRRTGCVNEVAGESSAVRPKTLDIGCAFGPYLSAASDAGWEAYGTDISSEAVDYVKNTLKFNAVQSSFPDFNSEELLGVKQFDAVTMWFVIEHFQDLDSVLKTVSKCLKKGGVFAFSTPSAGGVSGKYNTQCFFTCSPKDHYTLWEPSKAASILKRYGFKLKKTVITGHHPERFPGLKDADRNSLKFKYYSLKSKVYGLGDTFEVYCVKEKDIE